MASEHVKLLIHTSAHQNEDCDALAIHPKKFAKPLIHKKLSFQERLLRNSCIACALLLGILALGNIQQPWSIKASETIEKALTMEIDLDKSLGQMHFVQKLMPESALVFFNLNGDSELMPPVQGKQSHEYSETQPWLMFLAEAGSPVCAAAGGTVSAISPMSGGGFGILIDHGNGLESVTACLSSVEVQSGASVIKGGIIGKTEGSVYFELREGGKNSNPTERMGL